MIRKHAPSAMFVTVPGLMLAGMLLALPAGAASAPNTDVLKTANGDLSITFVGHATLIFQFGGKVIVVDPWSKLMDWAKGPKADLILVTHEHGDHLDVAAIRTLRKADTVILANHAAAGQPYHPKGVGNGYVLTFGDQRVYVAGDTENTPEMKRLQNIDCAFLPMNLPYTMTPEMVADAALAMKPKILYPYHFGDTDTGKLTKLLSGPQSPGGPGSTHDV